MAFKENINPNWISSNKGITNDAIEWAQRFGTHLASRELTTTQMRRFFGKIKSLQAEGFSLSNKSQLLMLKPYLAYAAARFKKDGVIDFQKQISLAINEVDKAKDDVDAKLRFKNFVHLIEAIVAFHKVKEEKVNLN